MEADDHGREGEGAQGRLPVVPRAPFKVSKEEMEAHNATHTPYRAWCEVCVRARGRNTPHMTRDEAAKRGGVPRISFDYFFASTVDEKASTNPILVMLDEQTGSVVVAVARGTVEGRALLRVHCPA